MNFHVVFGAAILVIQLARGLRFAFPPLFPVLPQHCYCVCIAFEHWLFPAKSFVQPTPLVSRGVVTLSINFSFAVFFLTCATDFPQKEELTVVQRILRGYKQFIITIQRIYYNLKGMSNIFSIFEKAPFSAYLNFVKQDLVSMTVNLKFSIFNGNGVQMKGSLGESCDQYVKGIVCVVLGTRCNLTKGLSKHA